MNSGEMINLIKKGIRVLLLFLVRLLLLVLEIIFALIFLAGFVTIFTIYFEIHVGIKWQDISLLDKRAKELVFPNILRETKREQRKWLMFLQPREKKSLNGLGRWYRTAYKLPLCVSFCLALGKMFRLFKSHLQR